MSFNAVSNHLFLRRQDFVTFLDEHDRLYAEAKRTGDYHAVTVHLYSLLPEIVDSYFTGDMQFVPPFHPGQTIQEAQHQLNRRLGVELEAKAGKHFLDIGCGTGSVIRDLSVTGANFTGIAIAEKEVQLSNALFRRHGCSKTCRAVLANVTKMPFEDSEFDGALAIYTIKYIPDLESVMVEIRRVLKAGARFIVYDLALTDKYDAKNEKHRKIVSGFEYATGMPALHSRKAIVESATKAGFRLHSRTNLQKELGVPFHYCFSSSPLFMFLIRSRCVRGLVRFAETIRLLPHGFLRFSEVFLNGCIKSIVDGGQLGILDGSEILVFEKE